MSYDVGNNPVSTMFSYEILNDGKYHTVQLLSVMKVNYCEKFRKIFYKEFFISRSLGRMSIEKFQHKFPKYFSTLSIF